MSIRKKLVLSYIAMILVPMVLFMATVALLFTLLFRNDTTSGWLQNPWNTFRGSDDLYGSIRTIADYDPAELENPSFLNRINEQLQAGSAGVVVLRNGAAAYVSPILGDANWRDVLARANSDRNWRNATLSINDRSYAVKTYAFMYPNGDSGGFMLLTDASGFFSFARSFFPLLFLALLLAIGLTNGLLTFFVSRSIIKPLHKLKFAADQIKEGNLDLQVQLERKDEIGKLGDAFEEMRVRLKESIHLQLQYEESRKELISNISHDLKTPITAIKACAEGVLEGVADTEEKRNSYMRMIHNKAADMDRLINELFLLSMLDLNKLPFHFEDMDLKAFLIELTEELRLHPQNRDINIIFTTAEKKSIIVHADREQLRRVVMNIVDNSVKHMKDQGLKRIELALNGGARDAIVEIQDNGEGMPEDSLPYIFERFYRAEASRSGATGGSGLGLAIVKQIVEQHGGSVRADSRPGAGMRITVQLPLASDGKG